MLFVHVASCSINPLCLSVCLSACRPLRVKGIFSRLTLSIVRFLTFVKMSVCSRSSFLRCTVYVAGCTQQVASVDVQSDVPLSSAATRLQRTRTRLCLRCLQQGLNHLVVSLLYPWQPGIKLLSHRWWSPILRSLK